MRLTIRITGPDGSITVACAGEITQSTLQSGTDPLLELIGRPALARKVRLDLEQADYIDSSGLGWLVGCHKRFKENGGEFTLVRVPPTIYRVLEFCGMVGVLRVERG
jgi:anti-anti-sigma factor